MKWIGYWSGIDICAESEEDNKILEEFFTKLPVKAQSHYDDGTLELTKDEETGLISLEFVR